MFKLKAQHAEALGAEAITAYAPSYYKPENEGSNPFHSLLLAVKTL